MVLTKIGVSKNVSKIIIRSWSHLMPRSKSLKIGDIVAKGNLEIIAQKTIVEGKSKTKRGYSKVKCNLCASKEIWY